MPVVGLGCVGVRVGNGGRGEMPARSGAQPLGRAPQGRRPYRRLNNRIPRPSSVPELTKPVPNRANVPGSGTTATDSLRGVWVSVVGLVSTQATRTVLPGSGP